MENAVSNCVDERLAKSLSAGDAKPVGLTKVLELTIAVHVFKEWIFSMSATSDKAISKKVTVLLSGGIDSTVLGYTLIESGADVSGIYVNYGQPAFLRGRAAVNAFAQRARIPIEVFEIPRLVESFVGTDDDGTGWICAKFYSIVTLAGFWASISGCDALAVGLIKDDIDRLKSHGEDAVKVIKYLANAVSETRKDRVKFQILMPLQELSKPDTISRAIAKNVPLESTWSCEYSGNRPCGTCSACEERKEAFAAVGRDDPGLVAGMRLTQHR